ncbi:uncharacterized protein EI90DRAFT_2904858, partial [Cantharellus anzutake]|uniref:uncharacterized protein n=1 Tax=Cantharellus anzutake TaxID=1750568 RepID=UPI0019045BB4
VKEINRINERELELGGTASWHDEYKDSAYIFVGGLPYGITEGDLIAICSQYGEIMDVNMPRDVETGKTKGFGFVMYEDQRSTILAVDNLNGGKVLDRTIRVDHVKNYKQRKVKNEAGELVEPEEQSLNAKPELIRVSFVETVSSMPSIDPEDPMRDYLLAKHKEEKQHRKKRGRKRPETETPEERQLRRERKRARRETRERGDGHRDRDRDRHRGRAYSPSSHRLHSSKRYPSLSPRRSYKRHSLSPVRRDEGDSRLMGNRSDTRPGGSRRI